MNAQSNNLLNIIIAPLAVMLFLTILMGASTYQLTQRWETATNNLTEQLSSTVILNNLRQDLIRIESAPTPQQAEATWKTTQSQVQLLATLDVDRKTANVLKLLQAKLFDKGKLNKALLNHALREDFFGQQLNKSQKKLADLKTETQQIISMMTAVMTVLGLILMATTAKDITRLFRQLRASRDLNITLQEEERRRIAQDLHDGVVQEMVDLKRHYSEEKVESIIHNLRRVCHNLKPQVLDDLGLSAALKFLADDLKEAGIATVRVNMDEEPINHLPKAYELTIFRVIQELFSNIKHHAKASVVNLTLVYQPTESPILRAHIRDNGQGFDVKAAFAKTGRMGLTGVKERIEQMGGTLVITSHPASTIASSTNKPTPDHPIPTGSTFEFSIPIEKTKPAKTKRELSYV